VIDEFLDEVECDEGGVAEEEEDHEAGERGPEQRFFAEIVGKIKDETIENRLMDRIDAELAKVGA
jgi:hypothetical protein